jgi:hypothetical protein
VGVIKGMNVAGGKKGLTLFLERDMRNEWMRIEARAARVDI